MDKLQELLQKMKSVAWVNRPSQDGQGDIPIGPQTDIVKSRVNPQGAPGGAPEGAPPAGPIQPQALDAMTSQAMAENPEDGMQAPPAAAPPAPYGGKMQHLATMGKLREKKYPELKPMKGLAGESGNGFGI
jgi:hypothetical protein